jgi:DNA-binding MurR/RpiR family transcriptional regulator
LAATVGVNEATVIRFAQRLGYRGFPEMVDEIRAIVRLDLEPSGEPTSGGAAGEQFLAVMAGQVEMLQRTMRQIPGDVVARAQRQLCEAETVVVVGQDASGPVASYLALMLQALGRRAESHDISSLALSVAIESAGPKSLFVGVSLSSSNVRLARVLALASARGAPTLALTDSMIRPCAQVAQVVLTTQEHDKTVLPAAGMLMVLVDALLHSVAAEDLPELTRRWTRLEELGESVLGAAPA